MNSKGDYNFMDGFMAKYPVMFRFWVGCGGILAAVTALAVWRSGAPDRFSFLDRSNYIEHTGNLIVLLVVGAALDLLCYGVWVSEGKKVRRTDGEGASKLKTGPIMAGVFALLITTVVVGYSILSILNMSGKL